MCGIGGFIGLGLTEADALGKLRTMADSLEHRGPDDEGILFDSSAGVGLVHRRLAIIDLSPTGHQPMSTADGRFVIVFNGEIYNFETLRNELADCGATFRGTSDTEVLLNAIAEWGIRTALERSVGMFALALWDRRERILYLARDRLGEKPLGLARLRGGFAFASEFSALRAADLVSAAVDRSTLALYLKYAYVPAPHAIYEDAEKLMPGSIVAIAPEGATLPTLADWNPVRRHGEFQVLTTRYWSIDAAGQRFRKTDAAAGGPDLLGEFSTGLEQSVRLQMRADVPVGAFLSGGIDSSLVCAAAQAVTPRPLKTFTMGFDDALFDESAYAARVAKHLGTDHQCVDVEAADVLKWVPKLAEISDEPFADPSQLPTLLVAQIARRQVTVCLTGDGGDELFGGYNRYIQPMRLHGRISAIPHPLARALAAGLRTVPVAAVDAFASVLARVLHMQSLRVQGPGARLHKLADALTIRDPQALYERLITIWPRPNELLGDDVLLPELDPALDWNWAAFADSAMRWDLAHYLPDNNLAKVDRASMACSLETRLPLLDHRIVELAARTPLQAKIQGGVGKQIMRSALGRYLPAELIERPKMGFSVPVAAWLRGPLKAWAEDLLSSETIARAGLFEAAPIRRCWAEHSSGSVDHYEKLWSILQAHSWVLGPRHA